MMKTRAIYITDKDMKRLITVIKSVIASNSNAKRDLKVLKEKLDNAIVVKSKEVSPQVITMNSKIRLIDLESKNEMTWRLVYPKEENISQGRISILAPLGMAILGHYEGDAFEWTVPSGKKKFKIESVCYQPESAGDEFL